MAGQLKQTKKNSNTYTYVEGNTVRKLNAVPERIPKHSDPRLKPTSREVRKNRQKALSMNGPYVMFLAAAVVVCLFMCMQYLVIQADNMKTNDDIIAMESEIDTLTSQNDSLDYTVNSFIDVNSIITRATQELGMVKATKDNIQLYESTQSEYMNQYQDIPN